MMEKAASVGADAVTFDLEDAVRPADTDQARTNLVEVLSAVDFSGIEVATRINGLHTDHWREDLAAAVDAEVDTVTVPKVETSGDVETVLEELQRLTDTFPEVILLLESPMAVFGGREIAEAARRKSAVTGLSFGVVDYARATGGATTSERIRGFLEHQVVGLATIGGMQPISSVYPDIGQLDQLRAVASNAAELGFIGQSVIHPDQVPVVNEVFTPDPEAVQAARDHVAAFEATDRGAIVHDDVFLDEALVDRYRDLIERAAVIKDA